MPPTATPTRVAVTLPLPPATPTRVAPLAVLPVDGGGMDVLNIRNNRDVKGGRNILLPGFEPYEISEPMTFRDRIVFQVEVFDKKVGTTDGAGIATVTFSITDPDGQTVHQRTEYNAGYCVFGGGEPDCVVWRFSEHGGRWPGGAPVRDGRHNVEVVIQPKTGEPVKWFWSFQIARP